MAEKPYSGAGRCSADKVRIPGDGGEGGCCAYRILMCSLLFVVLYPIIIDYFDALLRCSERDNQSPAVFTLGNYAVT